MYAVADSCCCMTETIARILSDYPSIKNKKNKVYNQQEPTVAHRGICSVFCNNLSGKRFEKQSVHVYV